MYLTQKNKIRNLSSQEFRALKQLCRLSKNMYNVGLYSVRQFYFAEGGYLRYESNYHYCKDNESVCVAFRRKAPLQEANYQLLQTDIAQQTLKVVDRSFKSFFNLIQKANNGNYRFEQIRLPRYLNKEGYFPLIIPRIKVRNGYFNIPMSRKFKAEYGAVKIPFPERLVGKNLKEVRIIPRYDARFFEVEFIAEEQPQPTIKSDNALAIDLGLDNLATCVSNTGSSFILDGRKLKSINQWYNKENSRLQSIKDKQGIKDLTKKQVSITVNRNNKVRDYLNKAARYLINWCRENKISTIVVGVNPGMKKNINLGKKTNQNFVQIPHHSLRLKLKTICDRYGLTYIEQEESYTSKASFLDGDQIPVYNTDRPTTYSFSGQRVKGGLYRTKQNKLINADSNGAANIGIKSNLNGFTPDRLEASLAMPLRVKFDGLSSRQIYSA
ncbi:MAG: IS200/IS605 family element transposase accessory protein TnpB [Okeania sp. SIO3B5]|uniref:RNA-guided endonuclease InsQ/TnpB family protein n=1 Tax=Okeania sp. SIO3B5 TaxID=2607811 RepID=UPI001400ACBE|nr:transposase [Okeania sp. SIO3B5]NEO54449.1 IS200/IS605 family element transposase accessory protein TnpB [Okeania sp. SIO3B5]